MEVYGDAMRRSRARAGRAALAGAALTLLVAACGSNNASTEDGPDAKTSACRGQWKDLEKQVRGNDEATNPSALAARWNTVVATIDYYASSATSSDCEQAITKQKVAISALTSFGTRLAAYDMQLRLEEVRDRAEAYAHRPHSPTPKPKPKKKSKVATPPSPAQVATALKTCSTQAPLATQQQGPAWTQARVVELTDKAAVAKAVKDLAFLSTQSPAYRSCVTQLARIKLALAAAK